MGWNGGGLDGGCLVLLVASMVLPSYVFSGTVLWGGACVREVYRFIRYLDISVDSNYNTLFVRKKSFLITAPVII